jgi:hypothetical protein
MSVDSIHARNVCNTLMQGFLHDHPLASNIQGMSQRKTTFRQLIEAAARTHPGLWKGNGTLNLGALERFYTKQGYPISQASFSRIFRGKQDVGPDVITATYHALKIPLSLLRNEPVSAEMERSLSKFELHTILLAQRLEELPKDDFYLICKQIEHAEENAKKVREALKNSNVTTLHRSRAD